MNEHYMMPSTIPLVYFSGDHLTKPDYKRENVCGGYHCPYYPISYKYTLVAFHLHLSLSRPSVYTFIGRQRR